MPKKLAVTEETLTVQVKMPASMKAQAALLAKQAGDGDISHWLRRLIHTAWQTHADAKRRAKH